MIHIFLCLLFGLTGTSLIQRAVRFDCIERIILTVGGLFSLSMANLELLIFIYWLNK